MISAKLLEPMPRLVAAVLPQMMERRQGRILLIGSAAALRGQKRTGSYSAARGAQLAYVQANPRFQERLKREVLLGRLVSAQEDAHYAGYLCSEAAACFVGQIFPISGGWAS